MFVLFVYKNPNPNYFHVGDCVIRAISVITGKSWEKIYSELAVKGLQMYDMPSSNAVWGAYLSDLGYVKDVLPCDYPNCFTVAEFCKNNPQGEYILATGSHVIAVKNGDYFDIFDSGGETPTYFFYKSEDNAETETEKGVK